MSTARRAGVAPAGHIDQRAHITNKIVHSWTFAMRSDRAAGCPILTGEHVEALG
jgi:hypothetical protein